uniref:Uncharacterized protein n=1 Tax=Heterorhabditis bacteriophora TaxID=37862 RepID=A0A1I7XPC0_HETBA
MFNKTIVKNIGLEAPLVQNSLKDPINVAQIKEDIMKKMNDIQNLELRKKNMEQYISEVRNE